MNHQIHKKTDNDRLCASQTSRSHKSCCKILLGFHWAEQANRILETYVSVGATIGRKSLLRNSRHWSTPVHTGPHWPTDPPPVLPVIVGVVSSSDFSDSSSFTSSIQSFTEELQTNFENLAAEVLCVNMSVIAAMSVSVTGDWRSPSNGIYQKNGLVNTAREPSISSCPVSAKFNPAESLSAVGGLVFDAHRNLFAAELCRPLRRSLQAHHAAQSLKVNRSMSLVAWKRLPREYIVLPIFLLQMTAHLERSSAEIVVPVPRW